MLSAIIGGSRTYFLHINRCHIDKIIANESPKLLIKIPLKFRNPMQRHSILHRCPPTNADVQNAIERDPASCSKRGVLEFKVEGERISAGNVRESVLFLHVYIS
jgi:hypothetical protein